MLAKIKINGLTKTQANLIAVLAEEGDLSDFINEQIHKRGLSKSTDLLIVQPEVRFDTENEFPDNQITFQP